MMIKKQAYKTQNVNAKDTGYTHILRRQRFRFYQLGWIGLGLSAFVYLMSLTFDTRTSLSSTLASKTQLTYSDFYNSSKVIGAEIQSLRQDISDLNRQVKNLETERQRIQNISQFNADNKISQGSKLVHKASAKPIVNLDNTKARPLPKQRPKTSGQTKKFDGFVINDEQRKNIKLSRQFQATQNKNKTIPQPTLKTGLQARFGIYMGRGKSRKSMRRYWAKLKKKHPSRLKGLKPKIIKNTSWKTNRHQLIAGPFSNIAKALEVCAVIRKKLDCELTQYK